MDIWSENQMGSRVLDRQFSERTSDINKLNVPSSHQMTHERENSSSEAENSLFENEMFLSLQGPQSQQERKDGDNKCSSCFFYPKGAINWCGTRLQEEQTSVYLCKQLWKKGTF